MLFDPENHVNKLCAAGMMLEGEGKPHEALKLFKQAWNDATNDQEKFIAAHYIARHQPTIADKLHWDTTALQLAQNIESSEINPILPSLYLNIAKCYEDLNDVGQALENYRMAEHFTTYLPQDGYGNMIRSGIQKGIERVQPDYNG